MKKTVIITVAIVILLAAIGTLLFIYIKPDDKSNFVVVTSPIQNAEISSPLTFAGRARGNWFFEGSFPVVLTDSYGNVIAESHATAQGEWTTSDFVKFVGNVQFNNYIKGSKGRLILRKDEEKDNPSPPGPNDFIEIPVIFK